MTVSNRQYKTQINRHCLFSKWKFFLILDNYIRLKNGDSVS